MFAYSQDLLEQQGYADQFLFWVNVTGYIKLIIIYYFPVLLVIIIIIIIFFLIYIARVSI